jgi:hypothetical protein
MITRCGGMYIMSHLQVPNFHVYGWGQGRQLTLDVPMWDVINIGRGPKKGCGWTSSNLQYTIKQVDVLVMISVSDAATTSSNDISK